MEARNQQAQGDDSADLVISYSQYDPRLYDDEDTEQHKAQRGKAVYKRHIRHYRHAKKSRSMGAALENFKPMWFAMCISAGGLGIVMNSPFPYYGRWEVTIATILYVFELVTFFTFLALLIARWIIYPHVALRRALSDPDELGSYAIPPIALITLASLTAQQVSQGSWGGHAFTIVAYVCWWVGMFWVFLTMIVVLTTLFYTGNQSDRVMTPVLFMAPVGLATAASEAGFITIYGYEMSAKLAGPQIVVGYFALGIAIMMAVILYTIYFHRLMAAGWAPAPKRAGLFILVGPCGQISTALQLLGTSAAGYMRLADYKPPSVMPPKIGTFWTAETASGLQGAGILLALLFLGFGYLCMAVAFIGIIDLFARRQATFSLVWWALVFPLTTICTSWLELSNSMDSPAFRGLVSALIVFLFIVFFINLGFTMRGIVNGSLIFGQTQMEIEDGMMKKAAERENGMKEAV